MRPFLFCCCLALATLVNFSVQAAEPTPEQKAIDKTIRESAAAFADAFNKRDAKLIASMWTEDAVYVNDSGERFEGRSTIEAEYVSIFKDLPANKTLRVEIDSVRVINSQTAIEEGRAAITPQQPGDVRVMATYTVIHTNQNGKWLMSDVRETRVELEPETGKLENLEWLVGSWSASNGKVSVEVKCRWIENRHFLARTHSVTEEGKVKSEGLEIIGWNPATGSITAWTFDGQGGHAESVWAPMENGWMISSLGVTIDGVPTGATYTLTHPTKDNDSLLWQSSERMLGDQSLPDLPSVTFKRK